MNIDAFLKPIVSRRIPAILGPMKAPRAKVLVQSPLMSPYVSKLLGKPCSLRVELEQVYFIREERSDRLTVSWFDVIFIFIGRGGSMMWFFRDFRPGLKSPSIQYINLVTGNFTEYRITIAILDEPESGFICVSRSTYIASLRAWVKLATSWAAIPKPWMTRPKTVSQIIVE